VKWQGSSSFEVANEPGGGVAVRNRNNPFKVLHFTRDEWDAFIGEEGKGGVKDGEFDRPGGTGCRYCADEEPEPRHCTCRQPCGTDGCPAGDPVCEAGCPQGSTGRHERPCRWAGRWVIGSAEDEVLVLGEDPGDDSMVCVTRLDGSRHEHVRPLMLVPPAYYEGNR
jgi:hypothetical protein